LEVARGELVVGSRKLGVCQTTSSMAIRHCAGSAAAPNGVRLRRESLRRRGLSGRSENGDRHQWREVRCSCAITMCLRSGPCTSIRHGSFGRNSNQPPVFSTKGAAYYSLWQSDARRAERRHRYAATTGASTEGAASAAPYTGIDLPVRCTQTGAMPLLQSSCFCAIAYLGRRSA